MTSQSTALEPAASSTKLHRRTILMLVALPAIAARRAPERLRNSLRITFTGIDPVHTRMTETQVRKVLSNGLELKEFVKGCSYLTPDIQGIAFMILDSSVGRVDVFEGPWRTVAGAGIGSSEAEIRRMYPRVRTEPHHYVPKGHYLIVTPDDPKLKDHQLLFETDGRAVTSFRAGLAEAVALVEGCA